MKRSSTFFNKINNYKILVQGKESFLKNKSKMDLDLEIMMSKKISIFNKNLI